MTARQPQRYNQNGAPICGAKTKSNTKYEFCHRPAGWGTDHLGMGKCKFHFGASPGHMKGALIDKAADLVNEVRRELLITEDAGPVTDPVSELQRLAGQVRSMLDSITDRLNEFGELTHHAGIAGEQLRPEYMAWEKLAAKYGDLLAKMASLGIAERKVRIEEAQAVLIFEMLQNMGGDDQLALTDAQRAAWPQVAERWLMWADGKTIPGELVS